MLLPTLREVSSISAHDITLEISFGLLSDMPVQSVTPSMEGKVVIQIGMFPLRPHSELGQFAERQQD